jgi:hypothetical protein
MNRIFLAHTFESKGGRRVQALVTSIGRLVRSHGLACETGASLGGNQLTSSVQRRIRESDALLALLTREEKLARRNAWRPTQWVQGELTIARQGGRSAIAIVQDGVEIGGPFSENEHIPLNLDEPSEALLRVSETISLWKEQAGRYLLIRLLPEAAANLATNGNSRCQFRLVPPAGPPGEWQNGIVRVQPGGVFLAVPGVKEDVAIDVEILEGQAPRWKSGEFPQWVHVEMRAVQ